MLSSKALRRPWPLPVKLLVYAVLAYIFVEFGDQLVPWLFDLLADLLEELLPLLEDLFDLLERGSKTVLLSLELLLDNFFEHTLHLSQRVAEFFTVWTGVVFGVLVGAVLLRMVWRRILRTYRALVAWHQNTRKTLFMRRDAFLDWYEDLSGADKVVIGTMIAVLLSVVFFLFF